jgi:hypothetical protein
MNQPKTLAAIEIYRAIITSVINFHVHTAVHLDNYQRFFTN